MSRTYYEILGIPSNATEQEIKGAYYRLARKYHPDKAANGADTGPGGTEFALVSTAYNVLKDREKRAAYDQSLEVKRQKGESSGAMESAHPSSAPVSESSAMTAKVGAASGLDKSKVSIAKRAFAQGQKCMLLKDYARAIECFEVALKNSDNEAVYFGRLAYALLLDRRSFNKAVDAAQKAISLDPYNSEFRLVLAQIYEAAQSVSLAVSTYEDILKWDPQNERALTALAELKPSKGSFLKKLFGKK